MPNIDQLRVVLRNVSPLIWRRVLAGSDTSIAELHTILQTVMVWDDTHLHRFLIHGKAYGTPRCAGISFADDPFQVQLCHCRLHRGERFFTITTSCTAGLWTVVSRGCWPLTQSSSIREARRAVAQRRRKTLAGPGSTCPSWTDMTRAVGRSSNGRLTPRSRSSPPANAIPSTTTGCWMRSTALRRTFVSDRSISPTVRIDVASADGMRFVVPVRTVHAGPNPKYFGIGRGVT